MAEQEREQRPRIGEAEVEAHAGRKAQEEAAEKERAAKSEEDDPEVEGHIRPKLGS
jgi:hypothetical protein